MMFSNTLSLKSIQLSEIKDYELYVICIWLVSTSKNYAV